MTIKQLSSKMSLETDLLVLMSITAVLFDKIHCEDMTDQWNREVRGYIASNGKTVSNFLNGKTIEWMSTLWIEAFEDPELSEFNKQRFLKSFRTRAKNMIKEKKSIYGLRYFITWLQEKMVEENQPVTYNSQTGQVTEAISNDDIDEEDIPFSFALFIPPLSYLLSLELNNLII